MKVMLLTDATDLTRWADRRDAQAVLPQLVRRLVLATGQQVTRASFRSGEGVQLAGWDGVVEAEEASAFVPSGLSTWELGVGKDIKRKANEDYEKRTREPAGIDLASTTFVFVTPRRWPGKEKWEAERRRRNEWHDVRVYDADDLASWLEQAPAAHLWISTLLGKHPEDTLDLETFWEDWVAGTRPPLPPGILLAGRQEVVARIHEWLWADPAALSLQAESREEALAVFTAMIHELPDDERFAALARAVIVRGERTVYDLAARESPLLLIMDLDSTAAVTHASRRGHRVLVPVGRENTAGPNCVTIPRLLASDVAKALVSAGVPEDRAHALAALARRSLTAFRRKLAVNPELQQPEWARPENGRALLPAMLAGSWNDACKGDREMLSRLGDCQYAVVTEALARWANESDPPVRRVGEAWYVVSRDDAWRLLARYLDRGVIERLEQVIVEVLGTPDPRFELPESEWYLAGVLKKTPRWSPALCRGLAEDLAAMATSVESSPIGATDTSPDVATRIVRKLMTHANTDWRVWASLSQWGVLPLLAEAAPDVFLQVVDGALADAEPILLRLFARDDGGLFVSSPHTGLLWALETLAWSEERLGYASRLLARLARLDPGGKLTNRPANSLRDIFLPWLPQTAASPEQRLHVLETLRAQEPEVTWRLMVQLLPKGYGIGHRTSKPKWREWCPEPRQSVSPAEYFAIVRRLVESLVQDAGEDGNRWKDLIEAAPHLPIDLHRWVVAGLESLEPTALSDEDRSTIWHALRELLSHHRSSLETLPGKALEHLDAVMGRFEPQSFVFRFAWLFEHRLALPDGREENWQEHQEEAARRQVEVARELYAQGGLAVLVSLAEGAKCPDLVGFALAQTEARKREEGQVLAAYLAAENPAHAQFAMGFARGRVSSEGRDWAEAKVRTDGVGWTPQQQAEFLVCLPADARTWGLANSLGPDPECRYWRRVQPFGIDESDTERAARSFLEHGRPSSAVSLLAHHTVGSPSLIAETLEALLRNPPDGDPHADLGYEIGKLMDRLQGSPKADRNRVARFECALLPLLRYDRKPRVLHEELAQNPEFFIEVLIWAFRGEGEEPVETSKEDLVRARRASELLDSWRTVPGDTGDGSVDGEVLTAWVARARELSIGSRHLEIGDEMIGRVLSGSPAGPDGVWPHPAVRDVIESIASNALEQGIEIGRYNSRGVVTRSPYEGGTQERQIAEGYERDARAVADRWPRTATMLRRMAEEYRADAAKEDREAELRQDFEA